MQSNTGAGARGEGVRCELHTKPSEKQQAQRRQYESTRPTSTQRGYTSAYRKARAELLAHNRFCFYCNLINVKRKATTADHMIPLSVQPDQDHTRMVPSCAYHNSSRGNKTIEEFTNYIRTTRKH